MTICTDYYTIHYSIPDNTTEEEWIEMKIPYTTAPQAEKKLGFLRTECPGRRWRVWHIEKKETLHVQISE